MDPSPQSRHAHGLAYSAAGMIVISPDALLLRLIRDADVWEIIFYRSLLTWLSLAVLLTFRYRGRLFGLWRGAGRAGAASAVLMGVSNFAFVGAILNTTVANTLVIIATMPLFAAVLGWLLIRERVRLRTWIAISVAFSGIVVIFAESLGTGNWIGDLMAMTAALMQALNLVILRTTGPRDMSGAVCLSGFAGAALLLPFASPAAVGAHDLGILALLGLVVLPLALTLFIAGARTAPAAEVALMALLETVLGPLWAWLGVGEVPSVRALAGGALVLGAILANALLALREGRSGQWRLRLDADKRSPRMP
ncbi:MAG TPA: EamA family transporter [Rhodospirillales bacterium]|jgi:drug/metabolite transporter (DMT)-like permease|nr:EamA family transporter [Rhodospirillales bacterium]HJO69082.1 EamA family transporter [Rhodospirillales bacterium]